MARALAFPAFVMLALGCSRAAPGDFWLFLGTPPGSGVELGKADVSPKGALVERRAERGGVALRLRRDLGPVRVTAPGGCPLVVTAPPTTTGSAEHHMDPLFELGPALRVVGPERRFEIRATRACPEAERASITLRVDGGAPLDDVRLENGGRALSATTRGIDPQSRTTWGIVPISAAGRGVTRLVARTSLPDGTSLERTLEVAALTRASGLPNVALGHQVLLAGPGFRLEKKPEGSRAELRLVGEASELVPDVRGDFALADSAGRRLVIQVGRYDEMPLDCGRSDCHATLASRAEHSPMTRALAADLGGAHALPSPECALACHATGEPGTDDGGFSHVMRELEPTRLPATFPELPRALRRLGAVGCLACHGPAAIPPESARWAVLRTDVCAVCHDAPPRYAHVAALGTTTMAHSDRDPRTRERPECARCHTTWGARSDVARRPPGEVGALGIGCAACHDVHGPSQAPATPGRAERGLLRHVDVLAVLPGAPAAAKGVSCVCIACHSPGSGPLPEASAAAVWAGRGGVDPETGAALEGPSPHASDARGCLACHDSGPSGLELGASHAFDVGPKSCAPCHAEAPKRRPELAARARALLDELVPLARGRSRSGPAHAEMTMPALAPAKARALKNALLVLEDPAADVHNPAYAERLLGAGARP